MFALSMKAWVNGVALATVATIFLTHTSSAQARPRFEFAPSLGAYLAMSELPAGPGNNFSGRVVGCPITKGSLPPGYAYCANPALARPESQKGAVAVGGRVTAWVTNRGAIEGSFWYSPSGVTGNYFAGWGNLVMADLRLVLDLSPRSAPLGLFLMGGPGVIHRYGQSWADVRGTTSPALSVGSGIDVPLGRSLSLRAQVGEFLSKVKFASSTGPEFSPWKLQHDFVLSLSLSAFGKREAKPGR